MSTPLQKGALAQLHLDRSRVARQVEIQLAALAERENSLKTALLDTVPKGIRFWLVEDLIITNLFESGKAIRHVTSDDLTQHRLGDKETFLRYVARLAEVWDGVVEIKCDSDCHPERPEISFKIVL